MNETEIETRVSAELEEAQQLFQSGRVLEAAARLGQLGAEARSAGDAETLAAIRSQLSQMRARVALADLPNFDRAANGLAQETVSPWAAVGAVFGFVLVGLVPVSEFFAWLGAGGVSKLSDLLVGLGFFAGVPLGWGLALLAPALSSSPGVRVRLGLVLVAWVAPLGALLATYGDYSERDMYLTIVEVGGVPGLLGLASIGWGVRDLVRPRRRRAVGASEPDFR